jgi:inorganic pyrophosphatase
MDISRIPPFDEQGNVYVIVETPKGSRNKYKYHPDVGMVAFDRRLLSAAYYPTDYGFVPGTKGADGDPLDALVLDEEPTYVGCLFIVRLIGVMTTEDDRKGREAKLLAVPVSAPADYRDIDDVPAHVRDEIANFFDIYRSLEQSKAHARDWEDAERAMAVLRDSIANAARS